MTAGVEAGSSLQDVPDLIAWRVLASVSPERASGY